MKEIGLILQLVLAIFFVGIFGDYLPENFLKLFYTFSVLIKEILVLFLPFIIFVYIFSSLSAFQSHAPLVIGLILGLVILSNAFFIYFAYGTSLLFLPLMQGQTSGGPDLVTTVLDPYFSMSLPNFISADSALILGVLAGLYNAFSPREKMTVLANQLKQKTQHVLTKVFIPIVPLFILGFLFKIQYENSLLTIFKKYGLIIGLILGAQLISIVLSFLIANRGNIQKTLTTLKTTFSSGMVAFSTMSSAATLPLTLEAAEKNTGNKMISQIAITSTVNIHHVGTSVVIPMLMIAVFIIYGFEPMTFFQFFIFSLYFMIAKFGVAAIPGGAALIMLPLLQDKFGFTHEMSGFFTALYMLMNSSLTATNVMCNGAFAILVHRLARKIKALQLSKES